MQPFVQKWRLLEGKHFAGNHVSRLEQLLKTLSVGSSCSRSASYPDAIMALERIGSPEALAVLEALATGAPGARET